MEENMLSGLHFFCNLLSSDTNNDHLNITHYLFTLYSQVVLEKQESMTEFEGRRMTAMEQEVTYFCATSVRVSLTHPIFQEQAAKLLSG